jgi:hypothetical protein
MKKRLNEVKRLQELAGIIKENNVGSNFTQVINSLSNDEKNKLLQLSKNVIEKAKKSGFTFYVNLKGAISLMLNIFFVYLKIKYDLKLVLNC